MTFNENPINAGIVSALEQCGCHFQHPQIKAGNVPEKAGIVGVSIVKTNGSTKGNVASVFVLSGNATRHAPKADKLWGESQAVETFGTGTNKLTLTQYPFNAPFLKPREFLKTATDHRLLDNAFAADLRRNIRPQKTNMPEK